MFWGSDTAKKFGKYQYVIQTNTGNEILLKQYGSSYAERYSHKISNRTKNPTFLKAIRKNAVKILDERG